MVAGAVLLAIVYIAYVGLAVAGGTGLAPALGQAATETIAYVRNLLTGDLGMSTAATSTRNPIAVSAVVGTLMLRSLGLLGLALAGLAACVVAAVRDDGLRPLATMSLFVTFAYAVVFKEAAAGHQFWLYWVLVPTAIGAGYAARAIVRKVRSETSAPAGPWVAVTSLLVLVGAVNLVPTTLAEKQIVEGQAAGSLVEALGITGAQQAGAPVRYIGQDRRPEDKEHRQPQGVSPDRRQFPPEGSLREEHGDGENRSASGGGEKPVEERIDGVHVRISVWGFSQRICRGAVSTVGSRPR